jgi:thiol-disulfide isomerase/thioredoxin
MKNVAVLLLLLMPLITLATNPEEAFFHKGDFEQVKAKAAQEGKLFFVDFYADYCYACKLMDETTFVDEKLKAYVKDNYVPFKVHILDFDGINLKEQYNINVLPTILVFNSGGELVGRYESMLGPTRMIEELEKFNLPENRISDMPNEVLAVNEPIEPLPQDIPTEYNHKENNQSLAEEIQSSRINGHIATIETVEESSPVISEPVIEVNENTTFGFANKPVEPAKMPEPAKPASKKRFNVSPKAQFTSQNSSPEVQNPAAEGLFQFTVKPYPTIGFGVQIGVFAEYGNVLREVQKLQVDFSQPILVNISTFEGRTVYKIIVGSFDSRREAISFRRMMQKKQFDGVIKDLASVKL